MNLSPKVLWSQGALRQERMGLSLVLVCVCSGLFVLMLVLNVLHVVPFDTALRWLGISRAGVFDHLLLYQFVSAPLTHGTVSHLVFNMLALFTMGPAVEQALGRRKFLVLCIACTTASLCGVLIFAASAYDVGFGASGLIFGVLTAQAVLFPHVRVLIFGLFPLKMRVAAILLAGIELALLMQGGSGIAANAGHLLGGLAALPFLLSYTRLARKLMSLGLQAMARTPRGYRRAKMPNKL